MVDVETWLASVGSVNEDWHGVVVLSHHGACDMSSPSPVQIREANAHLAALHRRVAELEERLEAAENTVREQAESLIRKDDQLRAATQEITEAKDR